MFSASAPGWIPAQTSLSDRRWSEHVSQINSFFPTLFLSWCLSAIENIVGQYPRASSILGSYCCHLLSAGIKVSTTALTRRIELQRWRDRCHGESKSFSRQTEFKDHCIFKEADQRKYLQKDGCERFWRMRVWNKKYCPCWTQAHSRNLTWFFIYQEVMFYLCQ